MEESVGEMTELGGFSEHEPNWFLRHDVDGCDDSECMACNGLPQVGPDGTTPQAETD